MIKTVLKFTLYVLFYLLTLNTLWTYVWPIFELSDTQLYIIALVITVLLWAIIESLVKIWIFILIWFFIIHILAFVNASTASEEYNYIIGKIKELSSSIFW